MEGKTIESRPQHLSQVQQDGPLGLRVQECQAGARLASGDDDESALLMAQVYALNDATELVPHQKVILDELCTQVHLRCEDGDTEQRLTPAPATT